HAPCDGRSTEQADCPRYRHRRIYGEGASNQLDAEDEGSFPSRAQPDGGYPQSDATSAAELLSQPLGPYARVRASFCPYVQITIRAFAIARLVFPYLLTWITDAEARG